jgi:hypothetical protein
LITLAYSIFAFSSSITIIKADFIPAIKSYVAIIAFTLPAFKIAFPISITVIWASLHGAVLSNKAFIANTSCGRASSIRSWAFIRAERKAAVLTLESSIAGASKTRVTDALVGAVIFALSFFAPLAGVVFIAQALAIQASSITVAVLDAGFFLAKRPSPFEFAEADTIDAFALI